MNWLPVMTLSDGTSIEIPMPSLGDTSLRQLHRYRVRASEGVSEFSTMHEVIDHLLDPGNPHREDALAMSSTGASAPEEPLRP